MSSVKLQGLPGERSKLKSEKLRFDTVSDTIQLLLRFHLRVNRSRLVRFSLNKLAVISCLTQH